MGEGRRFLARGLDPKLKVANMIVAHLNGVDKVSRNCLDVDADHASVDAGHVSLVTFNHVVAGADIRTINDVEPRFSGPDRVLRESNTGGVFERDTLICRLLAMDVVTGVDVV